MSLVPATIELSCESCDLTTGGVKATLIMNE